MSQAIHHVYFLLWKTIWRMRFPGERRAKTPVATSSRELVLAAKSFAETGADGHQGSGGLPPKSRLMDSSHRRGLGRAPGSASTRGIESRGRTRGSRPGYLISRSQRLRMKPTTANIGRQSTLPSGPTEPPVNHAGPEVLGLNKCPGSTRPLSGTP